MLPNLKARTETNDVESSQRDVMLVAINMFLRLSIPEG
jgi:hypothetical protein